ncbi:MAG: glycosyl transferase family 2 [Bacteroidetes bacterium HGW-Bacteroidetes-1]|jgi:cellulose synthase/poly-beta-1,6-N-acetylglucosamine synthase-like glycosyltransferase|nr:MAG: glycosyl transferase family 2 [Bacteroidetes bacterium HGW-Bacteroidetes-1]
MIALSLFLKAVELLLFIYLAMATIYIAIFGFASVFSRKKNTSSSVRFRKIAVLIPGYKEDRVIVDVAEDALLQDYPCEKYEVIVIADSFKKETLDALKALPIKVVEVVFEISKKSKALNKCMEVIGDDYDIVVILDADNIMAHDVLTKINNSFDLGFQAVQGHRMAKNTNTNFAILDAISEEINNNIFRKGHRILGLSSALIGSGMGIDYKLFKETMATVDSVGEDKEVEMKLLKQGYKIEYLDDAKVFDEKTSRSDVFVNQRRRWIAAQLEFFRRYFFDGLWNLLRHGNFDFFDKVLQMVQPPRILLAGTLFIFSLTSVITYSFNIQYVRDLFLLDYRFWSLLFSITLVTLLISTPRKFYNLTNLKAMLSVPHGFLLMIKSLLKIKGASKRFIHTTHDHVEKPNKK